MKYEEYEIKDNSFEYLDKKYDCSKLIALDKTLIIREAEISHKDTFDELYDRDSLTPEKVNLFFDEPTKPVFCMIIYTIKYKNESTRRFACGNYYPIWNLHDLKIMPHPYQGSICW